MREENAIYIVHDINLGALKRPCFCMWEIFRIFAMTILSLRMLLSEQYQNSRLVDGLTEMLRGRGARVHVDGMTGSLPAVVAAALSARLNTASQLIIASNKEEAFYLCNDLEALETKVMLFPTSYRKAYHYEEEQTDNANILMRSEVVKELAAGVPLTVVTYPEALSEKVVSTGVLAANTLRLDRSTKHDLWDVADQLQELGFEREDFVVEPGQYAVRGGIVDVFSYASDLPYRIEFFDDQVDSLRTYDPVSQLSVKQLDRVDIVPNLVGSGELVVENKVSLLEYFGGSDVVWVQSLMMVSQRMDGLMDEVRKAYDARRADTEHPIMGTLPKPEELCCSANELLHKLLELNIVEYGNSHFFREETKVETHSEPADRDAEQIRRARLQADHHRQQREPAEEVGKSVQWSGVSGR